MSEAESGRSPGRFGAALFVLAASTCFAVSSPISRYARPAHALFVAFGRVMLASIVLFALDPAGVVRHARELPRAVLLRLVVCGVMLGAHFALFQAGLDATSLPAAVSLVSTEPLSVVVCAYLVHKVRPSRAEQIGVVLATLGALVVSQGAGAGEHKLAGDLLVLGSTALFGFYVAAARSIRDALPARHAASLIYAVAAVVIFVSLPITGALDNALSLPLRSYLAILAIAIVPTVIGHTLVQAAARSLPPAVVALVSPGETLGSLLIGAALLGALPTGTELVGAAFILSGVLFAIFVPTSRAAPNEAKDAQDKLPAPRA